ncbi:MAG TPA: DUF4326 domain-containing protein, partial [Amnibacterium sp.]|uniref:DUF4326 domain-containing protein n=1 Tax=Amnibacterium sp. TaxID=1872496 RepID=UPI002F946E72
LSRRKGWRKPEGAIVVARPTRWGNPFSVSRFGRPLAIRLFEDTVRGAWDQGLLASLDDEASADVEAAREAWLRRLGGDPIELARTRLAGHDLACWCRLDQLCHADVLLRLANG